MLHGEFLAAMALDSSENGAGGARTLAPAGKPLLNPPRRRQFPQVRPWPTWALVVVQVGLLAAGLGLWELAADSHLIDAFFWSKPSAIFATLQIFLIDGDA